MNICQETNQIQSLKIESPYFMNICKDIDAVRYFYSELIGLRENNFVKNSHIDYSARGKTMIFFEGDTLFKDLESYSEKFSNKSSGKYSWCIKIEKEKFSNVVTRLLNAGIKLLIDKRDWRQEGIWLFSVIDPAGNIVEIYSEHSKSYESKNDELLSSPFLTYKRYNQDSE